MLLAHCPFPHSRSSEGIIPTLRNKGTDEAGSRGSRSPLCEAAPAKRTFSGSTRFESALRVKGFTQRAAWATTSVGLFLKDGMTGFAALFSVSLESLCHFGFLLAGRRNHRSSAYKSEPPPDASPDTGGGSNHPNSELKPSNG